MTNAETLSALLARVLADGGEDRELDADIAVALFGGEIIWKTANGTMECYPARRIASTVHVGGFATVHVPLYTSDLNAALSLVPTKPVPNLWPGTWWWTLESWPEEATAGVHYENHDSGIIEASATADSPARALLAACLRVRMEAQVD